MSASRGRREHWNFDHALRLLHGTSPRDTERLKRLLEHHRAPADLRNLLSAHAQDPARRSSDADDIVYEDEGEEAGDELGVDGGTASSAQAEVEEGEDEEEIDFLDPPPPAASAKTKARNRQLKQPSAALKRKPKLTLCFSSAKVARKKQNVVVVESTSSEEGDVGGREEKNVWTVDDDGDWEP